MILERKAGAESGTGPGAENGTGERKTGQVRLFGRERTGPIVREGGRVRVICGRRTRLSNRSRMLIAIPE